MAVRNRPILCLGLTAIVLGLGLPAIPSAAGDKQATETKKGEQAQEGNPSPFMQATGGRAARPLNKVYTNEDLRRLSGGETVEEVEGTTDANKPAAASGARTSLPDVAAQPDPLQQIQDRKKAQQAHAEKLAEAQKNLDAAKQRVAGLEKRNLALRNPYLARPAPPEEGDESEKEAWNTLSNDQRVDRTRKSLEDARKAVQQAQQELDRLRRSNP